MSQPSAPILDTILKSWTDAFRAIRDMPLVAACGLVLQALIVTGMFFAGAWLLLHDGRSVDEWIASPAWSMFLFFSAAIRVLLLAPLFIAIHRYVIRGQHAAWYPLNPLRPSYLRYVAAALAAVLAFRLPGLLGVLLASAREFVLFDLIYTVLSWATMVMVVVMILGKVTVFPAIAVNAPKAGLFDTDFPSVGQLMRTIAVVLGIVGPMQLAGWLVQVYVPAPFWPNATGQIVPTLVRVLVEFPAICALAAAMARLYLATEAVSATERATTGAHPAAA